MEPVPSTRNIQSAYRTVVVVDMVGYSTLARLLEENTGTGAVADLNRQIQTIVLSALRHVPSQSTYSKIAETGDGVIMLFEAASDAHLFAEQLHLNADRHNRSRTEKSATRWFRIGISTGELNSENLYQEGNKYAGITIANAVRLEAAAEPGEIVVDLATFAVLPEQDRRLYGPEAIVLGKRTEVFHVRKYRVITTPPAVDSISPRASWRKAAIMAAGLVMLTVAGIWLGHSSILRKAPPMADPDATIAVLQSVQAEPNFVHQGDTVKITVQLDRAAPRGGARVTLTSSDPSILTVDGNALIPQGDTTVTKYSQATAVPTYPSPIQIIATFNSNTVQTALHVGGYNSHSAAGTLGPPSLASSSHQTTGSATPKRSPAPASLSPPVPAALNAELLSRLEEAQGRLSAENNYWDNVKAHMPPGSSLRPEITSQIYAAQSASQRCNRDRLAADATSLESCIGSLDDHLNQLHLQH